MRASGHEAPATRNDTVRCILVLPEVHQSILDLGEKNRHGHIDSLDIIHWLLEQTDVAIKRVQPLYDSWGVDSCRRTQAALDIADFLENEVHRGAYLATLRQKGHKSLAQLYNSRARSSAAASGEFSSSVLAAFMKELDIRKDFKIRVMRFMHRQSKKWNKSKKLFLRFNRYRKYSVRYNMNLHFILGVEHRWGGSTVSVRLFLVRIYRFRVSLGGRCRRLVRTRIFR